MTAQELEHRHERSARHAKRERIAREVDVTVTRDASLFLFRPHTDAARDWIDQNVSDESQFFGEALVVEPRYARDLAEGMIANGLVLK